jgi:hypothetical protein
MPVGPTACKERYRFLDSLLEEGQERGFAKELGLLANRDTLLRRVRSVPLPSSGEVRVLGVDDLACRRGQTYGTILVDLERHKPIDLLPSREASSLSDWLQAHPKGKFIGRDRAASYADGASEGTPQAVEIADRWHLLKNLSEAAERFVDRHHHLVRQAAKNVTHRQLIDHWLAEARLRRFVHADGFPECAPKKSNGSILEPYVPYFHRRFSERINNASQERDYSGKAAMVRRYVRRVRARLSQLTLEQRAQFLGANTTFKAPTSKRAAWWLLKQQEDLSPQQQAFIEQVCQLCPEAKEVQQMASEFRELVRERQPETFIVGL